MAVTVTVAMVMATMVTAARVWVGAQVRLISPSKERDARLWDFFQKVIWWRDGSRKPRKSCESERLVDANALRPTSEVGQWTL